MNKDFGAALSQALNEYGHLFLPYPKDVAEQDAAVLEVQRIIDEGLKKP